LPRVGQAQAEVDALDLAVAQIHDLEQKICDRRLSDPSRCIAPDLIGSVPDPT
jgi:hypothetical protein